MAVMSVLTTLLGFLIIVVAPDGETRLTGVMCVLLFGLGPLHYLGGPRTKRTAEPPEGGWVVGACAAVFGLFLLLALYRAVRPQRVAITPTRVVVNGTAIP